MLPVQLDRCHTCNVIARFCHATLLRDKIAMRHGHVAHLHKLELTYHRSPHFRDKVAHNRALL